MHQNPASPIPTLTYFFRNRIAFEVLNREIIPTITKPLIRIGCVGCSDGREAYSVILANWGKRQTLEVTGYDYVPELLKSARAGEYLLEANSQEYRILDALGIAQGDAYTETEVWDLDMRCKQIAFTGEMKAHVRFESADILDKPLPVSHDIILAQYFLFHYQFPDRINILANLHKSIVGGGWLVCESDPTWLGYGQYFGWMKTIEDYGFKRITTTSGGDSAQIYTRIPN
jgi:chemotaxis methyl-accepting protein methylase